MTLPMPEMVKLKSSSLEEAGYDAVNHELHIRFKGGGHYVYEGVHHRIFGALLDAKSPGTYHGQFIKDVFASRKLK